MLAFIPRLLFTDPFRPLRGDPKPNSGERYTRQLLKSALIFDASLRAVGLKDARREKLLLSIVSHTGATYIRTNLTTPDAATWRGWSPQKRGDFAKEVLSRFENAEAKIAEAPEYDFGFNVHFCHFADLCRRLGRMDLAPLFCAADSVYFGDPLVPIRLDRDELISAGHSRCAFRFKIEE